jgi:hypothetical protein
MNVSQLERNFWLTTSMDGCKSTIGTGPLGIYGGFDLEIYLRENKSISDKKLCIIGSSDGIQNKLEIYFDNELIKTVIVNR